MAKREIPLFDFGSVWEAGGGKVWVHVGYGKYMAVGRQTEQATRYRDRIRALDYKGQRAHRFALEAFLTRKEQGHDEAK